MFGVNRATKFPTITGMDCQGCNEPRNVNKLAQHQFSSEDVSNIVWICSKGGWITCYVAGVP